MWADGKYRLFAALIKRFPIKIGRALVNAGCDHSSSRAINTPRQLVVDVSVLCRLDARTGIQRVVRALLVQLIKQPPTGYQVRTVYATKYRGYRYVDAVLNAHDELTFVKTDEYALLSTGDKFFGLDLSAHLVSRHEHQFIAWKKIGVNIQFLVYDLLPLQRPEWFRSITTRNFSRWLKAVTRCTDGYICISQAVRHDLVNWLSYSYGIHQDEVAIEVIPLGADIDASAPSVGISDAEIEVLATLASDAYTLMVGTVEPRKGYAHILDAFENMWRSGDATKLVIVGKAGWKTEKLQQRIKSHPMFGKKLVWMTGVSDELLTKLYENCQGVVVASEGEGFGLPLLEALHKHKPVLARRLPVFYEVARDSVAYFEDTRPAQLGATIQEWLTQSNRYVAPTMHCATWDACAQTLNTILEK